MPMTWTYELDGLGTEQQTLTVYDEQGTQQAQETRSDWPEDDRIEYVKAVAREQRRALREDAKGQANQNNPSEAVRNLVRAQAIMDDVDAEAIERRNPPE